MGTTADVVIIGGGVMGCGIAYYLAREGLKPVVVERSDIGGQASGSNGGGVRQSARNLKEIPLAMESVRMYGELHEELGMSVEYVRRGNLRLCTTDDEVAAMRASVENQKKVGLALEMLDRKQILEINPYIGEKIIAASYCPTDGHANPFLVTYGYFKRARERGALFHCGEEVTGITVKRGRVADVRTDKRTISTDLVIDAAGVSGRKIANMVGLDLPMQPVFSEALVTEPYPPLFPQMVGHAKGLFYGRQTVHGPFFWGGFVGTEQYIYRQGKPQFHFIGPAISRMVLEYFPVLKDVNVLRVWSGLIAGMSDGIPVLGLTEEVPGFVFCTGFSGHGFGLAPIVSRLISEVVLDCRPSLPIHDFCYGRFQKGKDHPCTCAGNATCLSTTAVCPNKREFVKNV